MGKPVVFISSTCDDLEKTGHRAEAREAALRAGVFPDMQEYWPAKGNPPLWECLARVAEADVLVVIVAHRFGWIPGDQVADSENDRKSITWLECEHAAKQGRKVLPFLIDDDTEWPTELSEEYELVKAVREDRLTTELCDGIVWRVNRLKDLKAWLSKNASFNTFTSPVDLRGKIESALHEWKKNQNHAYDMGIPPSCLDTYLRRLIEDNSYIDIRNLRVASSVALQFPIQKLYIPLKTSLVIDELDRPKKVREPALNEKRKKALVGLHPTLKHRKLVILGGPGTGKTTMLQRIVMGLCNSRLGLESTTNEQTLGLNDRPFPVLVSIPQLSEHIDAWIGRHAGEPANRTSPAWLVHFLSRAQPEAQKGLDQGFFESCMNNGPTVVLLDGLDETATRLQRETVAELITQAARCFQRCRFVVTCRPAAFAGKAVLPGFAQVRIDPLGDATIEEFLIRVCKALFPDTEQQASKHYAALLEAVQLHREIRLIARNPVMLTALAVGHNHEKPLSVQRGDLCESILNWLSRSRETRAGRLPAEVCINRLQELALAMQTHEEGRQVKVSRRWAAEQIAPEWSSAKDKPQRLRIEVAETFLQEEVLDSGIVVARGDEITFWHLAFHEYLAARAIAARSEEEQKVIVSSPRDRSALYSPEWREVVILLSEALHRQGYRKVDGFVSVVLDHLGENADLVRKACFVGLLEVVVQSLMFMDYVPADSRYQVLLIRVLAIFDRRRSADLEMRAIIAVAEALGRSGDPRFGARARESNWENIPGGEFQMGVHMGNPGETEYDFEPTSDESPVHQVTLSSYRIGRYPVTVMEYHRFVDAEGYRNEAWWEEAGFGRWQMPEAWKGQLENPNRPVVGLSWFEAVAYAQWAGCRLPTETQWERAARGTDRRRYPWGDASPNASFLNYQYNIGGPTPVGIYPEGATCDGIQDLAGNVWEWCFDWYVEGYCSKSPRVNPTGPPSGSSRVLRGGAWDTDPRSCRGSCRRSDDPSLRCHNIGFRLVSWPSGPRIPS